jgi:amidase
VLYVIERAPLLDTCRDLLKPEVIWNIEKGQSLDAGTIAAAERMRSELAASMASFFEDHDLLALPAAIVAPFDVNRRYIEEMNGHRFPSYIDWLSITFAITITGCPALSLPCGFTSDGLPVGLQLVAPPRQEARLLAMAHAFERTLAVNDDVPANKLTVWSDGR